MPGRPAGRRRILPLRLEEVTVAQPDENRIERARPQVDLQPQLVAVPPRPRIRGQPLEHPHGLGRGTARTSHPPNSTYVEKRVKPTDAATAGIVVRTARVYDPGDSRSSLSLERSLRFARSIALPMSGAATLENPAGRPRFRRVILVAPCGVSCQV